MSKTLLRHTLIKKIIFDIFVETLFKVSHTTVTNIFYCEEDIFGVIKEQNYYLNNKYASHVQRFQIVIFYLFLWTYVFFVVEVSFYFFLYIVFTPICFVKGGGHVLLMLFVFIYYHRSFCYSISQESISGEQLFVAT